MCPSYTHLTTTHLLWVDSQLAGLTQPDEPLQALWEPESLGICEEKSLYDEFSRTVTFQDQHYKLLLPWKEYHESLDNNYLLSVHRLKGLLQCLRHDPKVLEEYDRIIQHQLANRIIEPVPPNENPIHQVHYFPYHGIVRTDKTTTKLLVVYNASLKTFGPFLNECLYKGPKFHQFILDLLVRF